MDFALTDEQELLLESVREFCDRYFTDDVVKEMYENGGMPDEIAEAYRDAGFGLMGIPEEYGGIPADKVTLGLMIEELYHSAGCMHILYQNSLSMFDIMEFGTEEQKQQAVDHYMETGWPIASLSISEPGAGSDNGSMTCVAKKQADGTYRLSGQKTWVTMGEKLRTPSSSPRTRTPAARTATCPFGTSPWTPRAFPRLRCTRSASSASRSARSTSMTSCVTEEHAHGQAGRGLQDAHEELRGGALPSSCAEQVLGLAQAALEDAAAYAKRAHLPSASRSPCCELIQEKLCGHGDSAAEHAQHALQDAVEAGQRRVGAASTRRC